MEKETKKEKLSLFFQNLKSKTIIIGKLIIGIILIFLIYYSPIEFLGSKIIKTILIFLLIYVSLSLLSNLITDTIIYIYKRRLKLTNKREDNFMIGIKRIAII